MTPTSPAVNATKPRAKPGNNAVILYHTGSEQLRKCYDNFDENFGVRRDVSNKDRQR